MIYFCLCVLLLLCVGLTYLLLKSLRLNRDYSKFFDSSIEDLSLVIEGIDVILKSKPLMMEDQSVRDLIRGINLAHTVLVNYSAAKSRNV